MGERRKNNRRERTTLLLKQTLLSFLETMPLHRVQVSKLCIACHINRATFYAHYEDIYSLLREIQQDILKDLTSIMETPNPPVLPAAEIGSRFFTYLYERRKVLRALLLNDADFVFASQLNELLTSLLRQAVYHQYEIPKEFSAEKLEDILHFIVFGHYAYYSRFLLDDTALTPNNITKAAELSSELSDSCLRAFLAVREME